MSFLGNPNSFSPSKQMRTSDCQNYHPGEFLKRFDEQKQSGVSYYNTNVSQGQTAFKESFIGGLNTYTDDFYKSQVMDRTIGGEPVILNTMTNYQPLSADDPQIMDQIRQEHLKIMDGKLEQAIYTNGGNALQQVKTIIVQPLVDVVQVTQTGITQGYQSSARKSFVTSGNILPPLPPGKVSNVSIGGPILRNSRAIQRRASQVSVGAPNSSSRIQYVPFQRKVTQIETRQRIQRVPRERVIIEYEDRKIVQQVPVQKTVVDYYAVQHITQYQPQEVVQTIVEMVPIEKTYHTTNYIPIQQQIVHLPSQNGKGGSSRIVYQGPPTAEGNLALKNGQSRITYQPPITQSITPSNNIISYENPMINVNNPPFQHHRQLSRTLSNKSLTNVSTNNVSQLNVRPQQIYQQNFVDQRYQYQQPTSYMQTSNTVQYIPQAHHVQQYYQIPQVHQVQYQYPEQIQYYQSIQQAPQVIQYHQIPQQTVHYVQSSYPAPSQIQTVYQLPSNVVYAPPHQTYTINNFQYPVNNRFAFTQQPMPHEVVQQQKKIIRRQNSGISLTR